MTAHRAQIPRMRFAAENHLLPPSVSPAAARTEAWFDQPLEIAQRSHGQLDEVLDFLHSEASEPPVPSPQTLRVLWENLATVAAIDLSVARALEPHLDAAGILNQAGQPWLAHSSWGVYAAESPTTKLTAHPDPDTPGRWQLTGEKPWCSLADRLSHALVSAHTPEGRRTFVVALNHESVKPSDEPWPSHGLASVASNAVHFSSTPATAVGGTGWYLDRPGFALGGVGVSAIWFGGAVGLFRSLRAAAQKREPDQLGLAWLGAAERLLHGGAAVLDQAIRQVEASSRADLSDLSFPWPQALRVRGLIAELAEKMLAISAHARGPGPLTTDEDHLRRVADLTVYIRQHHAARDDAALGAAILEEGNSRRW